MSACQAIDCIFARQIAIFQRYYTSKSWVRSLCDKLPIKQMNEQTKSLMKHILDKYKNVQAVTFSTHNNDLVINFSGFESEEDLKDFADFVFTKIKMQYVDLHKMPSIH